MQDTKSLSELPVVFYNVENLFDTADDPVNRGDDEFTPDGLLHWDEERYRTKLSHLEHALFLPNQQAPLFIGLAEVENRHVIQDLIKTGRLATTPYRFVHYDSEDNRGIDCAFLYNSKLFDPDIETRYVVKLTDNPHFHTRDILYISGLLAGSRIHIFVNHWSSRREGQDLTEFRRLAAAQLLREKVDAILDNDRDANILIMGDFNDTPEDKSIRNILRAHGQHELQKGSLVNLLQRAQTHNEGTISHRGDWEVFDQLIVSQGLLYGKSQLGVVSNRASILRHEDLLYTYSNGDQKPGSTYGGENYYGGYSDHLPVYLFLNSLKVKDPS